MENRIEARLKQVKEKKEKAFITYITAGLPDMEGTKEIIKAQEKAGTDIIELGIPFSDPIADGPVIQQASYESIKKGTNLKKVFVMVKELRNNCQIPLVFMLYYNTVLYYGLEAFVMKCAECGVDGIIIPDLPLEEQGELRGILEKAKEAPILIQLVSPVSKDRLPALLKGARGFVYCVSSMGVTGQAADFHKNVKTYLKEVKNIAEIPIMMGFGIRDAKDVEPVKEWIDGAIVGSHFIQLMKENNYNKKVIQEYIRTFKQEMNR